MELSTLEIRINNTLVNIEKTRKTIERFEKQLSKRGAALEAQGVDLSHIHAAIVDARSATDLTLFWALTDYTHNLEDIERNQEKMSELKGKLADYREKWRVESERLDIPRIPALEEFLSQWKLEASAWYHRRVIALSDFEANWASQCRAVSEKYEPQTFLYWKEIYAEEKALGIDYDSHQRALRQAFSGEIRDLAQYGMPGIAKFDERLEKLLSDEVNSKRLDLYYRCTAAVGVITDASGLRVGENGSLNGVVVGENGKAAVDTIVAGGWNIQCLHYRVMVIPIREKTGLDKQIKTAEQTKKEQAAERMPPERGTTGKER